MSHNTNDAPLTPEQSAQAAAYFQFARRVVGEWVGQFPYLHDELDSAAMLGLCRAARSFDAARGVKFATFVKLRITWEMMDLLRRQTQKRHRKGRDAAPKVESLNSPALFRHDAIDPYADDSTHDPADAMDHWLGPLRSLAGRHTELFDLMYRRGMARHEARKAMGLSKSRVSILHSEGIALLRSHHGDAA